MKCRTCLRSFSKNGMIPLDKELSIGVTVKGMLKLFIPDMVQSKSVRDVICRDCMFAVRTFNKFIDRLIAVEKHLKTKESDVTKTLGQELTQQDNDNVTIKPINKASTECQQDSSKNVVPIETISKEIVLPQTKPQEKTIKEKRVTLVRIVLNKLPIELADSNGTVSNCNKTTSGDGNAVIVGASEGLSCILLAQEKSPLTKVLQTPPIKTFSETSNQLQLTQTYKQSHPSKVTVANSTRVEPGNKTLNIENAAKSKVSNIIDLTEEPTVTEASKKPSPPSSTGNLPDPQNNIEKSSLPPQALAPSSEPASLSPFASTGSKIKVIVPSMISTESMLYYDRGISVTVPDEETTHLLKSFFQTKTNLSWQSRSKTKRILFLGSSVDPKVYYCRICKMKFPSQQALNLHGFHQSLFQIENSLAKSVRSIETHPKSLDNVQPVAVKQYNCPACNESFHRTNLLNKHINRNHKDYCRFSCDKCGRKFKHKSSYKRHFQSYQLYQDCDVKKCHICEDVFSKGMIKKHYDTHRNIQCSHCDRKFWAKYKYKQHLKTHQRPTDKPRIRKNQESLCPICGKVLSSGSNLRTHLLRHTQNRNYMCDKCPKAYKTMAVLRKHQETVHGDKKYECETCGKMTKTISALQSHKMLKHTDIYKHACHICGATFKRSDYYRRHLQKHAMSGSDVLTPYKRYGLQTRTRDISSCKYCNSRFKNKVLLRKHLVSTHLSSGTTYKCAYCYMTFANKGNKMRHEKRHADPQLFGLTCEVCHCRFRTKEEVGLHAAKHKGSSRSFCNLCGETFPSKYLMMNHKRYQHFSPEIMAEPKAEKEEPVEEEVNLLKGGSSEYALESDEYFTSDILEWGSSETVITSAYLNC